MAFLTRLPVPASVFEGPASSLSQQAATFPLAAALASLPAALLLGVLAGAGCNSLLSAMLVIALQTVVTGALHEDGLADCADGLGGGRDLEQRLSIMKDSRIGAYGAIALILSIGIRVSALSALMLALSPFGAALVLPVIAAISRAAMVWHWQALSSARPAGGGIAADAGVPDRDAMFAAIGVAALICIIALLIALPFHGLLYAVLAAALSSLAFTSRVRRLLGGHTGDTIGACQQIAEIAAITCLALTV